MFINDFDELTSNAISELIGSRFSDIYMPRHEFEIIDFDVEEKTMWVRIYPLDEGREPWDEMNWNLQHCIWAFQRGEYKMFDF